MESENHLKSPGVATMSQSRLARWIHRKKRSSMTEESEEQQAPSTGRRLSLIERNEYGFYTTGTSQPQESDREAETEEESCGDTDPQQTRSNTSSPFLYEEIPADLVSDVLSAAWHPKPRERPPPNWQLPTPADDTVLQPCEPYAVSSLPQSSSSSSVYTRLQTDPSTSSSSSSSSCYCPDLQLPQTSTSGTQTGYSRSSMGRRGKIERLAGKSSEDDRLRNSIARSCSTASRSTYSSESSGLASDGSYSETNSSSAYTGSYSSGDSGSYCPPYSLNYDDFDDPSYSVYLLKARETLERAKEVQEIVKSEPDENPDHFDTISLLSLEGELDSYASSRRRNSGIPSDLPEIKFDEEILHVLRIKNSQPTSSPTLTEGSTLDASCDTLALDYLSDTSGSSRVQEQQDLSFSDASSSVSESKSKKSRRRRKATEESVDSNTLERLSPRVRSVQKPDNCAPFEAPRRSSNKLLGEMMKMNNDHRLLLI